MKILLVEDELAQRQILSRELAELGNEVVSVGTGSEAVEQLAQADFDVAVTDLKLPDFDGTEVIRRARLSGNEIPFLVITAHGSMQTAISALQAGANDYVMKPIRVAELARRLQQIDDLDRLNRENEFLRRLIEQDSHSYWCSNTPAGKHVRRLLAKVGSSERIVAISGEPGTGKGVTARLLHSISSRADGPFMSIDCAAIPDALMEARLFGFAAGAFEGVSKSQDGLLLAATRGTLLLDEIGDLSLPMQAKLLRAIEKKSIRPIGSKKDFPIDLRLIIASSRDLEELVEEGSFRGDLLRRPDVFQICLPTLRDQREAIPSAVEFFLAKHRPGMVIKIAREVWDRFSSYEWPGNLRELEHALERALVLCEDGRITLGDLPPALQPSSVGPSVASKGTLKERVEAFERRAILETLEAVGGDRRQAAEILGIGLSTLYRKLEGSGPEG